MCEWVIHGQYNSTDTECLESNHIRSHALSLMLYKRSGSIAAAVVVRVPTSTRGRRRSRCTVYFLKLTANNCIVSSRALRRRPSC